MEQGKNISEINFNQVKRDLEELNMQASDYLGVDHFTMVEAVKQTEFVKNMNVEIIPSFIEMFFSNIGSAIIGLFAVLFMAFFLLKDEKIIVRTVLAFSNRGDEGKFKRILLIKN